MAKQQKKEEAKGSVDNMKIEVVDSKQIPTPKEDSIGECTICLENMSDIMLPCFHAFCNHCITLWQAKQSNCPVCRSEILMKCLPL